MSVRKKVNNLLRKLEKEFVTHNSIEISRSALLHNLNVFAQKSEMQVIPVLKGNAYGHGIEQVTEALKNKLFPYIAVDGYFEALRIREISQQPVLVMGAILPENYQRIQYDHFSFVVQDEAAIHALGKTGKRIKVHLECNTGMNRYGVQPGQLTALTKLILKYNNIELEGVMSHLADSSGNNPETVNVAVKRFDDCVEQIRRAGANPQLIHIAQSAGSLKAQSKFANTMRLGIGLYGINPFTSDHVLYKQLRSDLQPALKLRSTITKITELEKGDQVSYSYTFTALKKMTIGVLPLGYYEGVNRPALSNRGVVKIGDQFAPIVGRVCMNHTMINLDGMTAQVGDQVIVYSDNPNDPNAIDAIAADFDLFNYNLLTSLSSDIRRTLIA